MLTATVYPDQGELRRVTDPAEISDLIDQDGCLVWLDVTDPSEQDLQLISEEFGLHPLVMEDLRHPGQRPKVESYRSHVFLVAYACDGDPKHLTEVDVLLSEKWLITVRTAQGRAVCLDPAEIERRFERTRDGHTTAGYLLYTVLDGVVDTYFDALDKTEDDLERIEGQIFVADHTHEAALQHELLSLRRELVMFRRKVVPLREVLQTILRQEVHPIGEEEQRYYQDVLDHTLRVIDTLETQRELLGNAVDAHLAVVNNNMNEIMKKMTSWGAILFGAALITGVYGMNFDNMPELHWRHGYFLALGMMVALTLALYSWFRKKGWL